MDIVKLNSTFTVNFTENYCPKNDGKKEEKKKDSMCVAPFFLLLYFDGGGP